MAAPIVPHAIPNLALFKQLNGPFNPFTFGKIFSLGTFTLSKTNSPVALARRLHLLCVVGVVKPCISLSTMTPTISPASFLAHTTATCANGALLIHILAPFNI